MLNYCNITKRDALILLVSVVTLVLLLRNSVSPHRFTHDEADYMYAVSKGLRANYLDEGAISFLTFAKIGLQKGRDDKDWDDLSHFIRKRGDITFYRHFHGPIYFYWLALLGHLAGTTEYVMRWASAACHILAFVSIYVGCINLVNRNARIAAVLASLFFLFCPANIQTAVVITPHNMYVLTVIMSLFMMAKLIQTNDLKYSYFCIVGITFAFLTIEYAVALLLTFACCILLCFRKLFSNRQGKSIFKWIIKSLGTMIIVFLVAWPAGLFKLTIIKNYLFFSYLTIIRGGTTYGTQSVWHVWWQKIIASPVEWLIIFIAAGLVLHAIVLRRTHQYLLPFLIYSFLIFLTSLLNRQPNPRYLSSFFPAIYIVGGAMLAQSIARGKPFLRSVIVAVLLGAVFLNSYFTFFSKNTFQRFGYSMNSLVEYFSKNHLEGKRVFLPRGLAQVINYYFPAADLDWYPRTRQLERLCANACNEDYDVWIFQGTSYAEARRRLSQTCPLDFETYLVVRGEENDGIHIVSFAFNRSTTRRTPTSA